MSFNSLLILLTFYVSSSSLSIILLSLNHLYKLILPESDVEN
nr:MAG TPA: hypothetical protein [Caudoviricetes sp.]